jgi:hypothetical protein
MRYRKMVRHKKKVMAGVGVATTLTAPAAAVAENPVEHVVDAVSPGTPQVENTVSREARSFAHDQLVVRTARLARIDAKLHGKHLPRGYTRKLRAMSTTKLMRKERALLHRIHERQRQGVSPSGSHDGGAAPSPGVAALLAKVAQCESGGNPRAIGGGGTYRGAYQFDQATWASVGGTGDPASASMAEQTRRAAILYSRVGPSAWPVCGS